LLTFMLPRISSFIADMSRDQDYLEVQKIVCFNGMEAGSET